MKKTNKSRKGFTLLEMMLALAIICMIGGVIAGICAGISSSFSTTYNIDDSSDYAVLYAKGFENSLLAATQDSSSTGLSYSWMIDNSTAVPYLVCFGTGVGGGSLATERVFEPRFMGNSNTEAKWDVHMFYRYNADTNSVGYCIFIKDNYGKTTFTNFYEGSFWVPRFSSRVGSDSRSIQVDTSSDRLNEDTFINVYGYTTEEYEQIHTQVDARSSQEWYSIISYTC